MSRRRDEYESLTREALAGCPPWIESRLDGAWLELWIDRPACAAVPRGELLRRNAELPGGVKFVLAPTAAGPHIQLRAEVPLDIPAQEVCCRVATARTGFSAALAGERATAVAAMGAGTAAVDLPARLREAGWPAEMRGEGSLAVDLGVPDEFLQAEIEPRPGDTLCTVALAAPASVSAAGRAAAVLLLLRAGGALRLARPALPRAGGPARFEAVLGADPSAGEIDHALAALAVACRLFAREVEVVQRSDTIATRVVAALGGSAHPFGDAERGGSLRVMKPTHVTNREEEERWHRQQPQR